MRLMTLPSSLATAWVVVEYVIKIVALGTIPENRRPSSDSPSTCSWAARA